MVFGVQSDPTWYALVKTYLAYLSTIVASTALNLLLIGYLAQSHDAALVITAAFSVAWSTLRSGTWFRRTMAAAAAIGAGTPVAVPITPSPTAPAPRRQRWSCTTPPPSAAVVAAAAAAAAATAAAMSRRSRRG